MRFTVGFTQRITEYCEVEVEADTKEEAIRMTKEEALEYSVTDSLVQEDMMDMWAKEISY